MTNRHDSILDACLREAVFDGWTSGTLTRAAESVGVSGFDAKRIFPKGIADVLDYFAARSDARMTETLRREYDLSKMKIRDRIATAVMVRLRENAAHREAIRRAVGYYAMPWNAAAGLKHLYATVDAMWFAAGDTSTDYNFYTKRLLLANVYTSTLTVWLDDQSPDVADTQAFLYRRIENVMQIEKLKAKAKNAVDGWVPCFSGLKR
jgi:ubiquinone biosynthesis protein COQ9